MGNLDCQPDRSLSYLGGRSWDMFEGVSREVRMGKEAHLSVGGTILWVWGMKLSKGGGTVLERWFSS